MPKSDKVQGLPGKISKSPPPHQSCVWASPGMVGVLYSSQPSSHSISRPILSHHSSSLFHTQSQIFCTQFLGPLHRAGCYRITCCSHLASWPQQSQFWLSCSKSSQVPSVLDLEAVVLPTHLLKLHSIPLSSHLQNKNSSWQVEDIHYLFIPSILWGSRYPGIF